MKDCSVVKLLLQKLLASKLNEYRIKTIEHLYKCIKIEKYIGEK